MSELIGRQVERDDVIARLGSAPVVTLTGPGGAGKTSLARSLTSAPADVGCERAVFCDLTQASTRAGVLGECGRALSVELGAADEEAAQAAIAEALRDAGDTLVVLDNAEQVQDDVKALVAAWMDDAKARLLVTSRFALGVKGEVAVDLAPLPVEDARALFVAHAERARPGFAVGEGEAALLDEVLERTDRLPLAIELAAARLEVLTLKDLDARLARGLDALKDPADGGRHGAVRTVLEATWELLEDEERRALAWLAPFAGGFSLDAAEAVLAGGEGDPLDLLQALKRRSLVKPAPAEEQASSRFVFLETIRRFAQEKLAASDDEDEALARHRAFFAGFAEREIAARGFADLARELDNLVAALARDGADGRERVWLALGVDAVLAGRGPLEARRRFLRTADEAATASKDARLQALVAIAVGDAERMGGDLEAAERELDGAIKLAGKAKDKLVAGRAKSALGVARAYAGDTDGARRAWEDALRDLDAKDAPLERAVTLVRLFGLPLSRGVFERESEQLAEEALDLFVAAGDKRWEAIVRSNLGILYAELGDKTAASAAARRAIELSAELGDRVNEGLCRTNLGLLWLADGEVADAVGELERGLALAEEAGDARVAGYARGSLGIARALLGEDDVALGLLEDARRAASARGDEANAALFAAWERVLGADREVPAVPDGYPAIATAVAILAGEPAEGVGLHPRIAARKSAPVAPGGLVLVDEGMRFSVDGGEAVDLSRRGPLRRVLAALVHARLKAPGNTLSVHDILDAGWPGEKVQAEAGANRVYTAIRQLRRMGLEELLLTRDAGYLLDPEKPVRETA